MSTQDPPADLIDRFVTAAESAAADPVGGDEARLRADLAARGVTQSAVVREVPSGTLAVALKAGFFLAEVFDELVVRYRRRCHSWLVAAGVKYDRAFDLTQEVLCRLLWVQRLAGFDPAVGGLTAYLRATVHNQRVSAGRRRSPAFTAEPGEPADGGPSPEEEAERAELLEQVRAAVGELPAGQRAVIEGVIDEQSHDEIAARLGLPKTLVYKRLCQARKALAARLDIPLPPTNRGRPRKDTVPATAEQHSVRSIH